MNTAKQLERTYMTRKRNKLYIACEEYDFTWSEAEIKQFREMWRQGMSIPSMSVELRRHQNELAILVIDQIEHKYIRPRKGGALGTAK